MYIYIFYFKFHLFFEENHPEQPGVIAAGMTETPDVWPEFYTCKMHDSDLTRVLLFFYFLALFVSQLCVAEPLRCFTLFKDGA